MGPHPVDLTYHYHTQDVEQELPQFAAKLRSQELSSVPAIAEGFRLAYAFTLLALRALLTLQRRVTEQPYKIPFYAALLYHLSIPASDINHADGGEENGPPGLTKPSLGRLVLDDFWKGFQAYLDKLAWRETRLCVRAQNLSLPSHIILTRFLNTDSLLRSSNCH